MSIEAPFLCRKVGWASGIWTLIPSTPIQAVLTVSLENNCKDRHDSSGIPARACRLSLKPRRVA